VKHWILKMMEFIYLRNSTSNSISIHSLILPMFQITWVFQKKSLSQIRWFVSQLTKWGFCFEKSNCTDGKRYCQLDWIPNFSQFWHTMTKIITYLNAKIWKLDVKTKVVDFEFYLCGYIYNFYHHFFCTKIWN
jgi:hypothetical protein